MDRIDFQDNGLSDHHQFFSGHTSYPEFPNPLKKYSVVFFLEIVKEIKLIRKFQQTLLDVVLSTLSNNPYFLKEYLILSFLEPYK